MTKPTCATSALFEALRAHGAGDVKTACRICLDLAWHSSAPIRERARKVLAEYGMEISGAPVLAEDAPAATDLTAGEVA